jgi:hypothetical protein
MIACGEFAGMKDYVVLWCALGTVGKNRKKAAPAGQYL